MLEACKPSLVQTGKQSVIPSETDLNGYEGGVHGRGIHGHLVFPRVPVDIAGRVLANAYGDLEQVIEHYIKSQDRPEEQAICWQ